MTSRSYIGKQNSTLRSVVPLAMFGLEDILSWQKKEKFPKRREEGKGGKQRIKKNREQVFFLVGDVPNQTKERFPVMFFWILSKLPSPPPNLDNSYNFFRTPETSF